MMGALRAKVSANFCQVVDEILHADEQCERSGAAAREVREVEGRRWFNVCRMARGGTCSSS